MQEVITKKARLENFPIMMFAIVMGLSGISIVYQKAHEFLGFSEIFSNILICVDIVVFALICIFYALKIIKYPTTFKSEFHHPIKINFFAAFCISLLLIGTLLVEQNLQIAKYFWYLGVAMQTFFTFYTISFWIKNNLEINHSNPAWFIPIVGNVIIPVGGTSFASNEFLIYFFSVGIFFWIIFTAIILNRIIFHKQLASKFMPTLFIFIAPASIGFISYIKITKSFDFFAHFLYDIGLFFTILLFFMAKSFWKIQFFISWWAFTFPLAAISIATLLAFHLTNAFVYKILSLFLIIITSIVVFFVAFYTIKHMLRNEICIAEH